MLRRGWFLILCLLASSLVATATVHARESSAAAEISCAGVTHSENDPGEAPGDADKGAPHHHPACHGHNVTAASTVAAFSPMTMSRATPLASLAVRLTRRTIDPALRPPRA
jgi:hypothetical protein